MHTNLNEPMSNCNAQARIWMREITPSGRLTNLNAHDGYFNLNALNAKSNDLSRNLNAEFDVTELFRQFEWPHYQIEWRTSEFDREILY